MEVSALWCVRLREIPLPYYKKSISKRIIRKVLINFFAYALYKAQDVFGFLLKMHSRIHIFSKIIKFIFVFFTPGTPGQATSYMSGQQMLVGLRNRAKQALGKRFDLKDFHYHILSQGQAPFDSITEYVDMWLDCEMDNGTNANSDNCKQVFHTPNKRNRLQKDKVMSEIHGLFKRRIHF